MVRSVRTFPTSQFLSLEYNTSSASSHRILDSLPSREKRSLRGLCTEANNVTKDKVTSFLRSLGTRLSKLHRTASRLVRIGMFSTPAEALAYILQLIIDTFPIVFYLFFAPPPARDQNQSGRDKSESSLGLSSCGSWSSFMHRSASGIAAPPPPNGNYFLRTFSKKSAGITYDLNSTSSLFEFDLNDMTTTDGDSLSKIGFERVRR